MPHRRARLRRVEGTDFGLRRNLRDGDPTRRSDAASVRGGYRGRSLGAPQLGRSDRQLPAQRTGGRRVAGLTLQVLGAGRELASQHLGDHADRAAEPRADQRGPSQEGDQHRVDGLASDRPIARWGARIGPQGHRPSLVRASGRDLHKPDYTIESVRFFLSW